MNIGKTRYAKIYTYFFNVNFKALQSMMVLSIFVFSLVNMDPLLSHPVFNKTIKEMMQNKREIFYGTWLQVS